MAEAGRTARQHRQSRDPGAGFRQRPAVRPAGIRARPIGTLFAIAQVELPGRIGPEDGRYLEQADDGERVCVVESLGVLPPARRRKAKPKPEGPGAGRARVPLTVFTVVFADLTFTDGDEAERWLGGLGPDGCDRLLDLAFESLDRLLATQAAAIGRPYVTRWDEDDALAGRVGYADGDAAYAGAFQASLAVDVRGGAAAPRKEKLNRSAPLRRVAAVLRGREEPRASELLVPRVRADLDAGRLLEAAAAVEVAVALVVTELGGLAEDDDHRADLATLEEMLPALSEVTEGVVDRGEPWPELGDEVDRAVTVAERVIRRIRVLDP